MVLPEKRCISDVLHLDIPVSFYSKMGLKNPLMRPLPTRMKDNTALMSNRTYCWSLQHPIQDHSTDGNDIDARNPIVD